MKLYKLVVTTVILAIGSNFYSSEVQASYTSHIKGEILAGNLSMSKPNDLKFEVKLNGKEQTKKLSAIKTDVTDYRGSKEGWSLSVKSPNYNLYNKNYTIITNNNHISDVTNVVFKNEKKEIYKELQLMTNVEVAANAQAGSYVAQLEWNLQPNTQKTMNE